MSARQRFLVREGPAPTAGDTGTKVLFTEAGASLKWILPPGIRAVARTDG